MTTEIWIAIPPQPWRRTRGKGKIRFTDPKSKKYKYDVGIIVKAAMKGQPFAGAVHLDLVFHMPIAPSWPKYKKASPPPHTSTPDLDNLSKAIKDALNNIAWIDDAQVNSMNCKKLYSDTPGILIRITADN